MYIYHTDIQLSPWAPSLLDFNRFSVCLQPLGLLCCGRVCWVRNHEHIALLGLCLSSPSAEAHKIARHLADYVLVWAGGGGKDDVGKSKHMARIANSVYDGHCNEEDCDLYGIFPDGKPSKMMETSLMLGQKGAQESYWILREFGNK